MLGFVCQVRPPVLHLSDAGIRIGGAFPLFIRALLLPLAIHPRQLFPRRVVNARSLRQILQVFVVALPVIPPHDVLQRRVRLKHRRIDCDRLPLHQAFGGQNLENPTEHGFL